jgi:hypothetical protein
MAINPDLIAPCGLYCGVCAIYIAHRDNMDIRNQSDLEFHKNHFSEGGEIQCA